MPQQLQFQIRASVPTDAAAIRTVVQAALQSGPIGPALIPPEPSEEHIKKRTARIRADIESEGKGKSRCVIMVAETVSEAADHHQSTMSATTQAGQIIGMAKWSLYRDGIPSGIWEEKLQVDKDDGINVEKRTSLVNGLVKLNQEHLGTRPNISVLPEHQGRGAGSALLQWGVKLADVENLQLWLEALPPGYPLYIRNHFVDVAAYDLDVASRWDVQHMHDEDWGKDVATELAGSLPKGYYRTVLMKREPRTVQVTKIDQTDI